MILDEIITPATPMHCEPPTTLVAALQSRALYRSDHIAYTFLNFSEEANNATLTYLELDQKARGIATNLRSLNAAGQPVLLLFPPGLDYIAALMGCLYAAAIAVPVYPPKFNRSLQRLQYIVSDAQSTIALTTSSILSKIEATFERTPDLRKLRWLDVEMCLGELDESRTQTPVEAGTLALIQYTSGSTGEPRGVVLTHRNLLHNSALLSSAFEYNSDSHCVSWLPMYHDMGLIGGIIQPLVGGYPCTLMAPNTFLQSPFRWLQAISSHRGTISGGPNFAYDLCVQRISGDMRRSLDLSSWTSAFNGAEVVRAETIEKFSRAFGASGFRREAFYPCYGLAEATLIVSGGRKGEQPVTKSVRTDPRESNRVDIAPDGEGNTRLLVGCGQALLDEHITIVDPETSIRSRPGEVGEIWVSGDSVAQGYWKRPEETTKTFRARLADTDEGPFLRTGDLGFLDNDQLFVTGRIKDLIIIRGLNYYPQDIEQTVDWCHPALRQNSNAAFSVEVDGEERLVLVQEINERQAVDTAEIIAAIRQAVSEEHGLQAHAVVLIRSRSIPKTSSGKIQRRQCRANYLALELEVIAECGTRLGRAVGKPDTTIHLNEPLGNLQSVERWLTSHLAARVGVDASRVKMSDSIMRYGLDSLSATDLMYAIETAAGVVLPITTLLQDLTIAEIAAEIHKRLATKKDDAILRLTPSQHRNSESPLSRGQQSLWFLYRLSPKSAAYNVSSAVRILTPLNLPALEHAFQALVDRHAALRTTFTTRNGEPLQQVDNKVRFALTVEDAATWSEDRVNERLAEAAHSPFQLERIPLMRAHLLQCAPNDHVLQLVVHHIVIDFWSLTLLTHELVELYEASLTGRDPQLAPLKLEFSDFVRWQEKLLTGADTQRHKDYWLERLSGELPVLSMPTDRTRPPVQSYRGGAQSFKLDTELTQSLKTLGREHGTTLYTTLLAAFQVLLHRYTGQERILVGSPTSGRSRSELAVLVGYFVNPVVLSADFSRDLTFEKFLAATRERVLEAFDHQDYPFALLVEQLQPVRDPSRSPLFQAQFVFQKTPELHGPVLNALAINAADHSVEVGGLVLQSMTVEQRAAQFDLSMQVTEVDGELAGSLNYSNDLFEPETISRFLEHFNTLLRGVVSDPKQRVSALDILTSGERRQLLSEWNNTGVAYGQDKLIHEMFEAQASRAPTAIALEFAGQRLTYEELDRRSNQLARRLRSLGVGPESLVGLCLERSPEMVIGLLGILKAGGAYLPLDPGYPDERLHLVLEDAGVKVLLTERRLFDRLVAKSLSIVCMDELEERIGSESFENLKTNIRPENLAYVIYTSGSTGNPKGVMITHQGIRNRLLWMQEAYLLTTEDRVLQKTPYSFDVSVWEFFWPLVTGARLVLARPGGHQDSQYLVDLIRRRGITVLHFVPSMLQAFLQTNQVEECRSLLKVICSGEALSYELQEKFFSKIDAELHNLYGPTEASVDVSYWVCRREGKKQAVPIGRPIANTQLYILDIWRQPVPVGVAGELYIGGDGLARGYLKQPQLTAERFVAHPFSQEEGARLYRTGDLTRFRQDGQIEYLGRMDHQVKVRGFRIELGEIETELRQHDKVEECVVVLKEEEPGDQRLIAYIVAGQKMNPTSQELRVHLKQRMPDYMLPTAFVMLDAMPLSPNGKVDRRALPEPERARPEETEMVAPRTALEELLANAWSMALKVEQVSVHDSFFELGGHSILATQLVTQLEGIFPATLPLLTLFFENPTIAGFADAITSLSGQVDIEKIARAYQNLEQLSDGELEELLGQNELAVG
jgi:amino acid adenylation domain-containing protein